MAEKNLPATPQEQKKQVQTDRHAEERTEERNAARRGGSRAASDRRLAAAAATLPNMPGPKPGGLAEMATPEALAASLERTKQRRADYEDAKVRSGIKDTRRPGNTPANVAHFADGMAIKPHDKVTIGGNPRFRNPEPAKSVTDAFPKPPAKEKK
jgi:hypothetical protein